MSTKTEPNHPFEFIVSEAPGALSRDQVTVTVPANTTLRGGSVMGQISATEKYTQYDDANTDGSEDAAGVLGNELANDTDAPVDVQATIVNLNAEVRRASLQFKDDVDEDGAIADLLALGIKAR